MSITGSDFTNVYSTNSGSIVHIGGSATLDLTATVTGGTFLGGVEASDGLMYGSLALYPGIVDNLETVRQGGAFFFGDSGTSTLTATGNTFKYFLNTGYGAVWYLAEGFTMTETNSFYYENGGYGGGVYYCEACTITATNNFYQDHVALDGSLFYLRNGFTVTVDQSSIGLGKSFYDNFTDKNFGRGGGVFVEADSTGAAQGTLTFSNCDTAPATWSSSFGADDYTITHFESQGDGGFIFSDHDNFHLTFDECVWNNYKAAERGGIIYGKVVDFQKLGTTAACAMTNITADGGGAFFYSTQNNVDFSLSGCSLACTDTYDINSVTSAITSGSPSGGKLMEFTGGTITMTQNTVENCFTDDLGGVIKMNGGKLIETKSTYRNNAGINGGVFYCDACELEVYGTVFESNKAVYGGSIYVNEGATVTLEGVTVTDQLATGAGGFLYAVSSNNVV